MDFKDYRHDRKKSINESIRELHLFIQEFAAQDALEPWYNWFDENFDLPKPVVKQFLMRKLAEGFDYIDRKGFKENLLTECIPRAQLVYLGYLAYIYGFRETKKNDPESYHLLIEVETTIHLLRYKKLIQLFGVRNVCVVSTLGLPLDFPNISIITKARRGWRHGYRNYHIENSEIFALISGLRLHKIVSREIGANLIYIAIRIIDSFFFYKSLLQNKKAKYLINFQHYHTDSVKNHVFKLNGGQISAVIQKNIHQFGPNGFFYDADVFFTYGLKTANSAIELGANFDNVKPVGSFFLEASVGSISNEPEMRWHVICVGGNGFTTPEVLRYTNTYDTNLDDYLEHLKWLHTLSLKHSDLRLGFKHHPGYKGHFENDFFKDSNVQIITANENTYEHAFRSGITVSWASTVVIELRGYGRLGYFLNPGGRNYQFITRDLQDLSLTSYQEFANKVLQIQHSSVMPELGHLDRDYCLLSDQVSERICKYLTQSTDSNCSQS